MGTKKQTNFKIDDQVLDDFDKALSDLKELTGINPIRQDLVEQAIKDITTKLRKQIELLKTKNPG